MSYSPQVSPNLVNGINLHLTTTFQIHEQHLRVSVSASPQVSPVIINGTNVHLLIQPQTPEQHLCVCVCVLFSQSLFHINKW